PGAVGDDRLQTPFFRQTREDPPIGRVVLDDQQAFVLELNGRGWGRRLRPLDPLGAQREKKRRASSRFALEPHASTHQLGQASADGEAETGASIVAGGRGVDLRERTKKFSLSL